MADVIDLTYLKNLKQYIDRPVLSHNKTFDRMVAELSKYLNDFEMDRVVDFMDTLSKTTVDNNMTPDDCSRQLRIILGEERYYTIKAMWSRDNQHLVEKTENKVKYIHKSTGIIYDGLDPEDVESDYEVIRM